MKKSTKASKTKSSFKVKDIKPKRDAKGGLAVDPNNPNIVYRGGRVSGATREI